MAPAADASPMRKEWVCRSQEECNAARRMCPKRARGKHDTSRNANNGPAKVGCVPSNCCNAVKGQNEAGAAEAHGRPPPPPGRDLSVTP